MSELVIEFGQTGKATAMHMDGFDLGFLGDMDISRQTDILFHKYNQNWNIAYIEEDGCRCSSPSIQGFDTYEHAREFEVLWLNECRLLGLVPTTPAGYLLAQDLREGYGA